MKLNTHVRDVMKKNLTAPGDTVTISVDDFNNHRISIAIHQVKTSLDMLVTTKATNQGVKVWRLV